MNAIIFDLDGVLCHTDDYHYMAWKAIADELHIPFNREVNNQLRGVSRMESLKLILRNSPVCYSEQEKFLLAEKKNNIYREYLKTMTRKDVSDEVRKTLAELRRRGFLLAIGSSSKNAKFILERVELTDAFDKISDGTNIVHSKPDPEVFLKAAEYLSLAPSECAVIEDAFAGIDAAKAGNMIAVAIGDATFYDRADVKLEQFSDLLALPIFEETHLSFGERCAKELRTE